MPRIPKRRNPRRPVVVVDISTTAALLDVSTSTLYRWISEDRFPCLTLLSGVMRVSLEHISALTGFPVEYLMQVVRSM